MHTAITTQLTQSVTTTRGCQMHRPGRAQRPVFVRVAEATAQSSATDAEQAVAVLRQAATSWAVPAQQVFRALWQVEKEKLPEDSWEERLAEGVGGKRWRLVFAAGTKAVKEGPKNEWRGGYYFPLTAVQRWDEGTHETEIGVYLGQILALSFTGAYQYAKKKLSWEHTKLNFRLGPKWFPFNISIPDKNNQSPFYLFFYVDDEIACARGRGGGYAIFKRTNAEWDVKAGITL